MSMLGCVAPPDTVETSMFGGGLDMWTSTSGDVGRRSSLCLRIIHFLSFERSRTISINAKCNTKIKLKLSYFGWHLKLS